MRKEGGEMEDGEEVISLEAQLRGVAGRVGRQKDHPVRRTKDYSSLLPFLRILGHSWPRQFGSPQRHLTALGSICFS